MRAQPWGSELHDQVGPAQPRSAPEDFRPINRHRGAGPFFQPLQRSWQPASRSPLASRRSSLNCRSESWGNPPIGSPSTAVATAGATPGPPLSPAPTRSYRGSMQLTPRRLTQRSGFGQTIANRPSRVSRSQAVFKISDSDCNPVAERLEAEAIKKRTSLVMG